MAFIDKNLLNQVLGSVAAGIGTNTTSSVNQSGFDGVAFVVFLGAVTIGSVITVQLQEAPDNATWTNAGTALSYTAGAALTTGLLAVEVQRPQNQYVRAVVTTATANAAINSVTAVQYLAKVDPTAAGGLLASSYAESI